ncbi:MAG: folate-binding protein [Burkholderiaceae bacterium]
MRVFVAGIRAFMNDYLNVAPLSDLVVIEAAGPDSVSFLQSQLTQDVAQLQAVSARLAGYCTAKGRLVASMVVWKAESIQAPSVHLLVKADIAAGFIKRLSMYILRAKVKLRITDSSVHGILIQQTSSSGIRSLDLPSPVRLWTVVRSDKGVYIGAPSANPSIDRWWFISTESNATSSAGMRGNLEAAQWHAADIAAGLPWITAARQDIFIPQTLNFDLIDGVSFSKGCYPGQEIVARSHYRGKIKRRMAYGVIPGHAGSPNGPSNGELAAADVFDAHSPAKPCGRVINAAQADQTHLLFEVQLTDLETADFRIGQANGPEIALQPLPYEIKEVS